MRTLSIIIVLITAVFSCKNSNSSVLKNSQSKSLIVNKAFTEQAEGYKLMKQNCYICHMAQSKEAMIAPPLFRIKEHYLPVYQAKSEFSDAIIKWVLNPLEENSLMPGAIRKFECMPSQAHIPRETLVKIAEYIFDNEMEKPGFFNKMHGNNQQRMRARAGENGLHSKKWKVDDGVIQTMIKLKEMLGSFEGQKVEDFQKLGIDVFSISKKILLNKNNEGEAWDQIHIFFNKIENDMHSLMSVKSIEKGKALTYILQKK